MLSKLNININIPIKLLILYYKQENTAIKVFFELYEYVWQISTTFLAFKLVKLK